jgi:hypothetical protein
MTGTVIFLVCLSGNPLIESFHKPAYIHQSGTPKIDKGIQTFLLMWRNIFAFHIPLREFVSFEPHVPFFCNNNSFCFLAIAFVDVQYNVIVVGHYGKCSNIQKENASEPEHFMFDEMAPMLI